jgi:predicted DNA-binding transcriptional regulator AlpA
MARNRVFTSWENTMRKAPTAAPSSFQSDLLTWLQTCDHNLKVPEVARVLAVSNVTVYRMAARKILPSFWAGGLRFSPEAIIDFIQNRRAA